MLIPVFWGKMHTEKQMGFAADFCPICRRISAFAIHRVGVASHFYFLPLDEGRFVGHSQTCVACRTGFESKPDRFSRLSKEAGIPIDRLAEETFPSVHKQFSERLALEERIAADPHALEPEERKSTLMEGFHLASAFFQNRCSDTGLRVLANALRPLDPSEDEVRECLTYFQSTGAAIGVTLRPSAVMKELKSKPSFGEFDY